MQVGKLAILLTFCAFSVDVTASNSRAVSIPLDWLLTENPCIQIRNISDREVEWFNTYFKAVKDSGRDLNTSLKDGETLLHFAVKEGSVNMVKALLAANVDVFQPNNEGVTAVEYAHGLADENDDYEEIWNVFKQAGYEVTDYEDREEGDDQQGEDMQGSYSGESGDGDGEDQESQDEDQDDDGSMDVVNPAQEVTSSSSANANASSPTPNSGSAVGMESPTVSANAGLDLDFDPSQIVNILDDYPYELVHGGVIMDTSAPPVAIGAVADTAAAAETESLLNSTTPLPVPSRYVISFPLLVQIPADKLVPGVQYTVI